MKKLLLAVVLFGLAAQGAATPEPEFHIPFEKYKLSNGLRVILARDNTLPLAAVYLIYDAGSRTEDQGHSGYSHLISRLMFEGSPNVKKGEYGRMIQLNGGSFNGSDHTDYTEFSNVMPSNKLPLALWLEADRMQALNITDENLKAVKDSIRAEKANLKNQPYRPIMLDGWRQTVFANARDKQPALNDADDVDGATPAEVARYFKTYYTPANAALVICGDFNTPDAKKLVDQYFGKIAGGPAPKRAEISEPERAQGIHTEMSDPHARFPAVIVGWPAPRRNTTDWYALEMLDAILTLGRGSRLEMELMRGRQSVLQVDENLGFPTSTSLDYRDPGYFAAMFIYKQAFTSSEIARQYQDLLSSIATSGMDSLDYLRARSAVRYARSNNAQTVLGRAQLLGIHEIIDGDAAFADRDYAAMLSVTPDQLRAAIAKYLTPARADVLSIKPAPAANSGAVR